jgi:hypothetical protein
LHRDAPPPSTAPAAEAAAPVAESRPPTPAPRQTTADFLSPFEDELDVPTFLRRNPDEQGEEDRELPAFLRRSAD